MLIKCFLLRQIQMQGALLDCYTVKEPASNAVFDADGSYEVNGWKHLKMG